MKAALTVLLNSTVLLTGFGLVALAGAGGARSLWETRNAPGGPTPYYFLYKQLAWLGISLVLGLMAAFADYHRLKTKKWLMPAIFGAVAFLLALTVLPRLHTSLEAPLRFLTRSIKGSYRWLDFKVIRLQPGELSKLAIVASLAVWLDKIGGRVQSLMKGVICPAGMLVAFAALLVAEPDYGSTMVVCVLGFVLMLYSGVKLFHVVGLGVAMVAPISALIALNDNRRQRLLAWLAGNESGDAGSKSQSVYQLKQATRAISNGGVSGLGYGESMQQYLYLPEAHTDFIFAIGAEEWGLWFSAGTVVLFTAWFCAGIYVATHAADRLGRLLAFGMAYLVGFQAVFNISVVCGTVPTKGLALPFMSYGGTNLMTAFIATGVIFGVGWRTMREGRVPGASTIMRI